MSLIHFQLVYFSHDGINVMWWDSLKCHRLFDPIMGFYRERANPNHQYLDKKECGWVWWFNNNSMSDKKTRTKSYINRLVHQWRHKSLTKNFNSHSRLWRWQYKRKKFYRFLTSENIMKLLKSRFWTCITCYNMFWMRLVKAHCDGSVDRSDHGSLAASQ